MDCHQCGKSLNRTDGHAHVSEHILLKLIGLSELGLREEVSHMGASYSASLQLASKVGSVLDACGFCGKTTCGTMSMKPHSKTEVVSECPCPHSFVLGRAIQTTGRHPSTNVPVHCPVCPPEHPTLLWKYSMFLHIKQAHPHLWNNDLNQPKNLPASFLHDLRVTQEEVDYITKARPLKPNPTPKTMPGVSLPFNPVSRGIKRTALMADQITNSAGTSSSKKKPKP